MFRMEKRLDGRQVSIKIKENIRSEITFLRERKGIIPSLTVIIVGNNKASEVYVRNKERACQEVGIESQIIRLPETTTEDSLIQTIEDLNQQPTVTGILVQLPLPAHINTQAVLQAINPAKDVDGFHPTNVGRMQLGLDTVLPCTPMGILTLLEQENIELEGKHVVILGRSDIVGKPMAQLCLAKNATVTLCHSKTQNIRSLTQQADVLIVAIGKAQWITADDIKEGAIVIDVGINRLDDGRLVGDVDFESVFPKCHRITPVPGGVGPMTITSLLANTLKCLHVTEKANRY